MASLDELLAKMSQAMGYISRAMPNFKKLSSSKKTYAVVQGRIASLKEKMSSVEDLDARIRTTVDAKAMENLPYFSEDHFMSCGEQFEETLDYMVEVLAALIPGGASGDLNVSHSSDYSSRPSSHLPRINLPTFSGSFDQWESYRDRFKSMIVDNRGLSNVERMHYLCASLSGDASDALQHLSVTEANFAVAWDIIRARYENKRRLINGHLQTLFSLPQLSSETFKDLQTLRDKANAAMQALRNLGCPVDAWNAMLVFLVAQKLDKYSRKAWELQLGDTVDYPLYNELDKFMETRIRALEAISPLKHEKSDSSGQKPSKSKSIAAHSTTAANLSCPICQTSHLLYQCPSFLAYTPSKRYDYIKRANRCLNCLGSKHAMKTCKSARSCKICQQKHHTLLHFSNNTLDNADSTAAVVSKTCEPQAVDKANEVASHLMSKTVLPGSTILLATAYVRVYNSQNQFVYARALLDQGSVATLASVNVVQRLRLAKVKQTTRITGIGESQSLSRYTASIRITPSAGDEPAYSTRAYVIKTLTKYIPNRIEATCPWKHTADLTLADGDPMSSTPIDLIIGADLYGTLLLSGLRKGADTEPIAQNTTLGWVLSGPISPPRASASVHIHHGAIFEDLDLGLRRFWEVEEIPERVHMSHAERQCEDHFTATHSRTATGRYEVRLPFKSGPPIDIGESRSAAMSSLFRAEQRLRHEPKKAASYREFLEEYEKLGHMTKVTITESLSNSSQIYYIPHHAVFRDSSVTTRLRVVFNASCRTSNGTSLNDHLLIGPKLQTDITAVILQWRQFRFVYAADIAKMYRQILVNPQDVDYQRILWRPSPFEPVGEYRLRTVTYGTSPAPYQALRVLRQLADDEGSDYPLAVSVLRSQTYVDDCTFGADTRIAARQIRDQLVSLLRKGGFHLRKWASNCPELLSDIDPSNHGLACAKDLQMDEPLKILGVAWNPDGDNFQFRVSTPSNPGQTKRAILSAIAKFFDPLGWAAPVVVVAKIIMQRLWVLKSDWDDILPKDTLDQWLEYHNQLPCLESISIPRWTRYASDIDHYELHGFSDASTRAYAAVVYLRIVQGDGSVTISLLAAKSKVAPLKTLSIPRLELAGALLLARLLSFVTRAVEFQDCDCRCWTDSTITLAWLKKSPSEWKVFVANRVAEVQNLIPRATWHYVPTAENPADCASRGVPPRDLAKTKLWWSGPIWLKQSAEQWPTCRLSPLDSDVSREKRVAAHIGITNANTQWDLATRYSSWSKLLRVTAYLARFVRNLNARLKPTSENLVDNHKSIALVPREIQLAKVFWLKKLQAESFPQEMSSLNQNRRVAKTSVLAPLNPYRDQDGLIRVGGRLGKANLPEATKHPIILRSHPLLSLLISHAHHKTLHGGPQLTLAHIRTEFWILRARATVRAVLYRCVKCARENAVVPTELMGNLPDVRINRATRAFEHTGVDYAGPILVRTAPGRGHKTHKAYIALFVCMTTKAVHLELVSDYSSAAFLAAFARFVSRRGLPNNMYSDNGTTFHGADRELAASYNAVVRDSTVVNQLSTDRVSWHFLPPASPHFGGLWEAGVRSVKHHLKRCIGCHTLTYEEMNTLLCRVEACLNSRPLSAVSDNLDDYTALTPGHFLIGANLVAIPEPSVLELSENRLSRWQLVQRITEGFWRSWISDYLHTLQQRPKWRVVQNLAHRGQIVLVRNPLAPPSHWELGRITACHPGDDGLTRVVTVKTARTEYKRPIVKLCFLPIDINLATEKDSGMAGGPKP